MGTNVLRVFLLACHSQSPTNEFMNIQFVEVSEHNLNILRHEVSVYNGGVKSVSNGDCEMTRRKTLKTFVPITSKNSASVLKDVTLYFHCMVGPLGGVGCK